jgi:hypothetical protein
MSSFSLLEQDIKNCVDLPAKCIKNTLIVSECFQLAQSVNLNKAKDFVPQVRGNFNATVHADYKLLTRFFDQGKITDQADRQNYEGLMRGLQTLCWFVLFQKNKSIRFNKIRCLSLDGTKWDFGNDSIHLLTLCVIIDEVAIPIWWEDIEKAGHSSQKERISYFQQALKRYDLSKMIVLADREYIGYQWFEYLHKAGLYFVIRLKAGIYHDEVNASGNGISWERLTAKAKTKKAGKKVSKKIMFQGMHLDYIIVKNPRPDPDEELVYLLSNWTSPTQAAQMYALRWQIEVCFKQLKSNGLDLEKMNVEGKEKRHLMMAIAVFIYTMAIREGMLEEYRKGHRILFKKDKRTGFHYRAISVFRKGISILRRSFFELKGFIRYLKRIIGPDLEGIFQNV